ncbi:MAG: hypothetical protein A2087_08895 [Spirochaetes bacterium GWD1_61_31]|nr:MAG: hypothetical protein A2Y37_13480 [Spirochaetes bacterium GWB1_60_80]OHD30057.1 MAG: hypothetical protein A2004_03550 [Spirochaetes bacterium GWC1_61_12]OHD42550.1 MAG: hypothetical protein A2087_08895 [Spirochaetes bacterium GWD1_61_31]OHD45064.1 MAG: hypothetical protein A2Y35_12700 [Spirochaetes bacterium GWE1_60_18]OHD59992.1 MAG: hypothetical protein A2Y32_14550 [Spirochaetes bacterium GWF1_60_12]HAP42961.1 hypothetical protein [Spirochaetaceae bacterium]
MEKLGRVILRYLIVLIATDGLLVGLTILQCIPSLKTLSVVDWEAQFGQLVRQTPLIALPAATILTCFLSFYHITRLFRSRLAGYLTLGSLNLIIFCLPLLLRRLVWPELFLATPFLDRTPLVRFLSGYRSLLVWLDAAGGESWLLMPLLVAPAAWLTAALWPLTRFTRQRPLFGALLGPAGCIGLFYLFSVYLSPSSNQLFKYIGFTLPAHHSAAILSLMTVVALYLFDLLFAYKPLGVKKETHA